MVQFVLIRLASINTLCSSMIACQVRWLLVLFFLLGGGGGLFEDTEVLEVVKALNCD
jgi:hypothetical protein